MPIYQYECESCGRKMEYLLLMTASRPHFCTFCEGPLIQKFGRPAIFVGKAPLSFHQKFTGPHYDSKKP